MHTITLDDIDVRTRVKIENRAKKAQKTTAEMAAFLLDERVGVTRRGKSGVSHRRRTR